MITCGTYHLSDLRFSKSKMLHQAAANIGLDGFNVKSIAIFEKPLTAIVHLENEGKKKGMLQRLVSSTQTALEGLHHNFTITLKLSDDVNADEGVDLTYYIERKGYKNSRTDDVTIELASRISEKVMGSVAQSGAKIHQLLPTS